MPQDPARHDAPAEHRGPRAHPKVEGLVAPDPQGLGDRDGLPRARVRVGQLTVDRDSPVSPADRRRIRSR
jgi:hypothetical protein